PIRFAASTGTTDAFLWPRSGGELGQAAQDAFLGGPRGLRHAPHPLTTQGLRLGGQIETALPFIEKRHDGTELPDERIVRLERSRCCIHLLSLPAPEPSGIELTSGTTRSRCAPSQHCVEFKPSYCFTPVLTGSCVIWGA